MTEEIMDDVSRPSADWETDANLADDIFPQGGSPDPNGAILLTGATGYFGKHLLRELLSHTNRTVYCLARSKADSSAANRVLTALQEVRTTQTSFNGRLRILEADISASQLALDQKVYRAITSETSTIVHCAANVSWSRSYSKLREDNVEPVAQLLRLAGVGAPKQFCLISSMAVCYSTDVNLHTDEDSDPWFYFSKIPLGYAQSKCVAERLVRQVAARGLSGTIVRPALIVGNTSGGAVANDDFVAQLIHGCIRMGRAPDVDWRLDIVPVDYAAAAVARNLGLDQRFRMLHISHPDPRDWREVVLFLNLFGYAVRLEPFEQWCQRLANFVDSDPLPLQRFLGFFTKRPNGGSQTVSQVYEARGQPRISSARSIAELARQRLPLPRLDAGYFDQYLRSLIHGGLLDPPPSCAAHHHRVKVIDKTALAALRPVQDNIAPRDFTTLKFVPFRATHSITSEIASWRYGGPVGLYELAPTTMDSAEHTPNKADLILKIKARDDEVIATVGQIAAACGKTLGRLFERFGDRLEFCGADRREAHIYESGDRTLLSYLPRCYAVGQEPATGRVMILLERLKDVELLDSVDRPQAWSRVHIEAAICSLAHVHAAWYGRGTSLANERWLAPTMSADNVVQMADLWDALYRHSKPLFSQWGGDTIAHRIEALVDRIGDWMPRYGQQKTTLIHNDCNPRNLAFWRRDRRLSLCIYDWELCTVGAPQRDLAELLCFVLDHNHAAEDVWTYVELHRIELSRRSGVTIDADYWREGFSYALADFMLRRLSLYGMLHSFVRQSFLPRVVKCWQALDNAAGVSLIQRRRVVFAVSSMNP